MAQGNSPRADRPRHLARRIVVGTLKGIGYTLGGLMLLLIVLLIAVDTMPPAPTRLVNDSAQILTTEATQRLERTLRAYYERYGVRVYVHTDRTLFSRGANLAAKDVGTHWRDEGVAVDLLLFLTTDKGAMQADTSARPPELGRFAELYQGWATHLSKRDPVTMAAMPAQASELLRSLPENLSSLSSANSLNVGAVQGALWKNGTDLAEQADAPSLYLAEMGEMELALAAGVLSVIAHNGDTLRDAQIGKTGSTAAQAWNAPPPVKENGKAWVWIVTVLALTATGVGLALWRRRKRVKSVDSSTPLPAASDNEIPHEPTDHAAASMDTECEVQASAPETNREDPTAAISEESKPKEEVNESPTTPAAMRRKAAKGCLQFVLGLLIVSGVLMYIESLPETLEDVETGAGTNYLLPMPANFVNDSGHLLDAAAEARLEKLLRDYEYYTSAELFVVTSRDRSGYDANAFTTLLGNQWNVGKLGKDNGMILYVCGSEMPAWDEADSITRPRGYYGEGYLAIGSGLETYITDADAMRLIRNELGPHVAAHRYEEGIKACAEMIMQRTRALRTEYMQNNDFAERRVKEEPMTQRGLLKGILGWVANTLLMMLLTVVGISPIIGVCFFFRRNRSERFAQFYLRWTVKALLMVFAFSFHGAASRTASKLTSASVAKASGGIMGGAGGGARL